MPNVCRCLSHLYEEQVDNTSIISDDYRHNDILNVLPLSVLELIFSYLDTRDLISCSLCSLTCYQIQNQDIFWFL